MESLTSFVSSRGILKACDAHNLKPVSSDVHIDADLSARHRPHESIYVCSDALGNFSKNFLDQITSPFVLVSGDSDLAITGELLSLPLLARILQNEHLSAWFAQNLSARHPKLFPIPIGLEYHLMWESPGKRAVRVVSPIAQEYSLLQILASSPQFHQRFWLGHCNWQFSEPPAARTECQERIDKSVCYFEPLPSPRHCTWMRQAQFMFVISPEGAGMDCHRTWEAILLGSIPVVKRNATTSLLDGLPALIVDDWQEVTREALQGYAQKAQDMKFHFAPVFRETWARKIAQQPAFEFPAMTLEEFRNYLTGFSA